MPRKKASPPTAAEGVIQVAEFVLRIERYSHRVPYVIVRGFMNPEWHFFKDRNEDYIRRYCLTGVDPQAGVFPLAEVREHLKDIQHGIGLMNLRFIVEWFTPEEVSARDAMIAAAADRAIKVQKENSEALKDSRAAQEEHTALVKGLAVGDPDALAAAKSGRTPKPAALAQLDKLVPAS